MRADALHGRVRLAVGIRELAQESFAALGAQPARFSTKPAVVVVRRVQLAFCPTRRARPGASLHDRAQELLVAIDPAREESSRRRADVGTAEIEPNAAPERDEIALGQARISANETGKLARDTGFHAVDEHSSVRSAIRERAAVIRGLHFA